MQSVCPKPIKSGKRLNASNNLSNRIEMEKSRSANLFFAHWTPTRRWAIIYVKGAKNDAYVKEARYGKQICNGAEAVSAHTHGRDLHGDVADGEYGATYCGARRVCANCNK